MMDFRQLLGGDMNIPTPGQDVSLNDTAETIQISSLALLKVLPASFSPIIDHGLVDAQTRYCQDHSGSVIVVYVIFAF